jgi:hypothetical protein
VKVRSGRRSSVAMVLLPEVVEPWRWRASYR